MSSAKVEEALLTTIDEFFLRESIDCASGILVAYSGGIDSTALLYLLACYRNLRAESLPDIPRFPLFAHYVDHRLRSAAELEAEWRGLVANTAHIGVPLSRSRLGKGQIDRLQLERGEGPEAAARDIRYRELEKQRRLSDCGYIAFGHTLDDLTETMMARFFQGCGISGLHGIPPRRKRIIRPLLSVGKDELTRLLQETGIAHCEDSTNRTDLFQRNRLRSGLVPAIFKEFPAYRSSLARSARVFREEEEILKEESRRRLQWRIEPAGASIATQLFFDAPQALRVRSLFSLINHYLPGRRRVPRSFIELEQPTDQGARTLIEGYGFRISARGGLIRFIPLGSVVFAPKSRYVKRVRPGIGGTVATVRYCWAHSAAQDPDEPVGAVGIPEELSGEPLIIRSRRLTDTIATGRGARRLKEIFVDQKVTPELRDSIAVVQLGSRVIGLMASAWGYTDVVDPQFRPAVVAGRQILYIERTE